jgi:hypothetical protein
MAAFTVAVGAAMSREEAVDCHCFGRLHSAPATARALIRNCALLAVAGLTTAGAFSDPGPSATRWISRLSPLGVAGLAGGVLVLAVLAAQSWLIVELLRRNGRLLRRLDVVEKGGSLGAAGLPVGSPAPRLSGDFTGRSEAPLHVVRSEERAAVLVFVEWGCAPCSQLLSELANGPRASAGPKVTVIGPGPAATAAARQRTFNLREVIVDEGGAIAASYGVRSTPSAVGVTDGAISSPLAEGAAAVRALLGSSAVLEPIRAIEAYGA